MQTSARLYWVTSSTTDTSLLNLKAAHYVEGINLKEAKIFEPQERTLARVICDLRHYFRQDVEQTIELILGIFNKLWMANPVSEGAVRLTWRLVEPYTPVLGLDDPRAVAKRNAEQLYNDVLDMVAETALNNRIPVKTLRDKFLGWNLDWDYPVTDRLFSIALKEATGWDIKPIHGVRYLLPPAPVAEGRAA